MGCCNYYSSYVPNYAVLAGPLYAKLKLPREEGKKGSQKPLTWTTDEIQAFEDLKVALAKELQLFHLNPDQPFILKTDASKFAIGAVLEQERDGVSRLVAFFSKNCLMNQRS